MRPSKILIFDFDGTLADTLPLYVRALGKALPADVTFMQQLRQMPLQNVFGYLKASPLGGLRVLWFHLWQVQSVIGEAEMWDGLRQAVISLAKQGHKLCIVSSNYERNVRAFLKSKQLENCFEEIRHVNVTRKPKSLRRFVSRHEFDSSQTYYIGNDPWDITAAHYAGIQSVAVLWSGQNPEAMQAQNPTATVSKPAELLQLFTK